MTTAEDDEMDAILKEISDRRERAVSLKFDCSQMPDETAVLKAVDLCLHWPMEISAATGLTYSRIRDAGNRLIEQGFLVGSFCSCGQNGSVKRKALPEA